MTDREKVAQLLESVPDDRLPFAIAYLQGLTAGTNKKRGN